MKGKTPEKSNTRWPIVPLGSQVKFLSGGTPSKQESKYWDGEIPWVSSGEMSQRRIYDTALNVTEDGVNNGTRLVPPKTILVVVRGMSLAKEFRVAITARPATFNQDLKAIIPSKNVDPDFLFYYLLSQNAPIKDSASEAAHGTKKLDMPVLEQWPLPLPPLDVQEKIAAILSAYDDLIENNKRRIALLEKMAEEIYREWFVRMRFPGCKEISLDVYPLRKLIDSYIGGDWGSEEPSGSNRNPVYVIRGTDFEKVMFGDISQVPLRYIKDSSVLSRKLMPGDIVVENSVNHKSRTSGKSLHVTKNLLDMFDEDVICASFCKLIRPKKITDSKLLALNFRILFQQGLFDYFQNIATNGIANLQVERFLDRHQIGYSEEINFELLNYFDTSIYAKKMGQLVATRDRLLSRLISGKLSVEDLDIQFPPSMCEDLEPEKDVEQLELSYA